MRCCQLCNDISTVRPAPWNEPLFESDNFVVLPSLGALLEGWLIVLPKKHVISAGALDDQLLAELGRVKTVVASKMQRRYGAACAFEHGPSKTNSLVGCGVDHAHLHIVPSLVDVRSAVQTFLPEGTWWSRALMTDCQTANREGQDYLYLEQPIGVGFMATHRAFGSQLFRKAIASEIGTPDEFNWREHPQIPKVMATIREARAWFLTDSPLTFTSER
jgi:diadenosine tetraphosphate (Ap4A) HIT family hydrolase